MLRKKKDKIQKKTILLFDHNFQISQLLATTPAMFKVLWPFFRCGELQNLVHHKAYCKGCVSSHITQAKALEQDDQMEYDLAARIVKDSEQFAKGKWA